MVLQQLQLFIRSKNFDNELTFKLLDISRRLTIDQVIEGLLDLIGNENDITYAELENQIEELQETIGELKIKNAHLFAEKQEREEEEIQQSINAATFNDFVEKFQNENDRYPSINETWEACAQNKLE